MTISIPEVPYDWTGVWIWLGVLILLGLCITVGALILKFKNNSVMLAISVVLGVIWGLIGGAGSISDLQSDHSDRVGQAQINALAKIGYDNVDLDDNNVFTASKDGRYVKGYLIEVTPDRKYQVTELVK